MIDTKNIEIGQQEGARGFVQFFSILAQCAMVSFMCVYSFKEPDDKRLMILIYAH